MFLKRSVMSIIVLILSIYFYSCSTYQSVTGYFNTYYNAKKLFNDALIDVEKSSQKDRDSNYFAAYKLSQGTKDKFDKVIEKSSKVIRDYPQSSWIENTLFMMGKSYYYKGESEAAMRKFKELLDNYPDTKLLPEIRLWEAKTQYIARKEDEVLRVINESRTHVESSGDDDIYLQYLLLKGQVFFDRGEYDSAVVAYTEATAIPGSDDLLAIGNMQLGQSYERLNKYTEAGSLYGKAIQSISNASQNFKMRLRQGIMLYKSEKYPEAMEVYDDLKNERLKPEESALLDLEIANTSYAMGDSVRAYDLYRMIDTTYKRTEGAAKAYYMRGLIYENTYLNFLGAKSYYDKAKTEFPAADITTDATRRAVYLASYEKLHDNLFLYDSLLQEIVNPQNSDTSGVVNDSSGVKDSSRVVLAKLEDTSKIPVPDSAGLRPVESVISPEKKQDTVVLEVPATIQEKTYIVGTWATDRECLWNIAKKKGIYDNPWMWTKIWQRNRDKIKNPDLIKPKWVLKIPDVSERVLVKETIISKPPAQPNPAKISALAKPEQVSHKPDSALARKFEPPPELEELKEPPTIIDSTFRKTEVVVKEDSSDVRKISQELTSPKQEQKKDSIRTKIGDKDTVNVSKNKPAAPVMKLSLDSLRTLIVQTEFELGGLFHIEINLPDSAVYWYNLVVDSFPKSSFAPRAYYALSEIYRAWEDTTVVDSIYNILLTKYDTTQYAQQVRKNMGLTSGSGDLDSGAAYFQIAESLFVQTQHREALKSYQIVAEKFPLSPYAPKALYTVGWIYETIFIENDTAASIYKDLIKKYPSSIYAEDVKPKIAVKDDPKSLQKYIKVKEIPLTAKTSSKKTSPKEKSKDNPEVKPNQLAPDENLDEEEETPPEDEEDAPEEDPDTTDDEDGGGG
jgi:TolA-binding protein